MLTELERRAWATRGSAEQHKPEMALKAALDQIERGEFQDVRHVLVVVVERVQQGDFINFVQAGDLSELAVEGALARAARIQASREKEG